MTKEQNIQRMAEAIYNAVDRNITLDAYNNPILYNAEGVAQAAYEASDARYVPELVEALKTLSTLDPDGLYDTRKIAKQALAKLEKGAGEMVMISEIINIGKFTIYRRQEVDWIWIDIDGEGGAFSEDELETVINEFYEENF